MGICMFTITISVIEFLVKIATVGILYAKEPDCKNAIANLPTNLKSIISGPTGYQAI